MAIISFDEKSPLISGNRLQLVSGAFHYFRVPRSEWADRLHKCKQAGLNTIETIVPWNIHEYREGEFTFSDNRNLSAFLELCQRIGFYTIVRPSPYICGEWDNGGIPSWLTLKDNVGYRRANPVYLAYTEKWYDVLMPLLAKHQLTRGGSMILVQIENEYGYFQDAQEKSYMESLRDMMIARGIEVPLVTCDWPGKGFMVPGAIKCANFGSDFRQGLALLRAEQPGAFAFVSELWLAWFDHWGGKHQTRSGRDVANALKEVLAAGGHYNFYMWAGGTNFGYFAGRTTTGEYGAFITTSYDYDAPIGETGNVTEKFYECRLVNWLANSIPALFAASTEADCPWEASNPAVDVNLRESASGQVVYLRNTATSVTGVHLIEKATGKRFPAQFDWTVPPGETMVLLQDTNLTPATTIVRCSGEVLGLVQNSASNALLIYGDAGRPVEIVMNVGGIEQSLTGEFPLELSPSQRRIGDVDIVLLNRQTAYVTCIHDGEDGRSWEVNSHYGKRNAEIALPELHWAAESDPLDQLPTQAPHSAPALLPLEVFGVYQGYGWYRTCFEHEGGKTELVLTDVHDRATVFINGVYQGVIGSFASFSSIPIYTNSGSNELVILLDALGRYTFTARLGEQKGLLGRAYLGGSQIALDALQASGDSAHGWQTTIPWQAQTGVVLRIAGFTNQSVTVGMDNHILHEHRMIGDDDEFVELDVTTYLRPGGNSVWVTAGEPLQVVPRVSAVRYDFTRSLDGPWQVYGGVVGEDSSVDIDEGVFNALSWQPRHVPTSGTNSKRPRLYRAAFNVNLSENDLPLKLLTSGVRKGVAWINGHHLGRHWHIGPQTALYIPREWLQSENTLILFDEEGCSPDGVVLIQEERFL